MEGVGGKPAWAWIFIIEGLVTVVAGALSFFIIQDFPDTAKFLTEAERTFVVRRLQSDDQFSAAGESLKWHYIWKSIFDWKTWVGSECPPVPELSGAREAERLTGSRRRQCSCTWARTGRCMRSRCSSRASSTSSGSARRPRTS